MPTTMKAVRLHARGGPDGLVYEDAPMPHPAAGDALVRVHATGITPAELTWEATSTGRDGRSRLPSIPGHEVSGTVAAVAEGVTEVKVGEDVFGLIDFWRDGSAAEYVAVRAADLAPKPRTLDHVQAAATPLSALTAWQALFDHADLRRGQRLLIHGTAGGVGIFAVQLGRWRGAQVIGTASSCNADFLRDLGADAVIDYRTTRFEDAVSDVDVVLDTVGGDTTERSWAVLARGGILVSLVQPPSPEQARAHGARGTMFIVTPDRSELTGIARLIDAGQLRPVIETVLHLARAREAYGRGLRGHNRGKIVLQVLD